MGKNRALGAEILVSPKRWLLAARTAFLYVFRRLPQGPHEPSGTQGVGPERSLNHSTFSDSRQTAARMSTPNLPRTPTSFPSPPKPTPISSPSKNFPWVYAPKLPHRGTAIARLKANLGGLVVYCGLWWQRSIYETFKNIALWSLQNTLLSSANAVWLIGTFGAFIRHLLWSCRMVNRKN